ncbi:hypothetical protein TIFTF001_004349 [Ficus carica]|uniref:Uncharacterized protein n=1 Tax=Ficus carica TaxID=3494 RepID=A0AA88CXQ6_FICCA|nr:hypothetical protein TIFTF001_004349 [Ficus carica]
MTPRGKQLNYQKGNQRNFQTNIISATHMQHHEQKGIQQYKKTISSDTRSSIRQSQLKMGAVSLEALAMANVNHLSFDLDVDEWEHRDRFDSPPPHLLADEDDEQEQEQEQEHEAENDDDGDAKMKKIDIDSDMRRCLKIWVNKVMRDARKYTTIDERRDR